jgi:hypothetical protein
MMVEDALKYPFHGDRTLDTFAVGGVLAVFAAFYCHLVAARYVGLAYARAVGRAGGPL